MLKAEEKGDYVDGGIGNGTRNRKDLNKYTSHEVIPTLRTDNLSSRKLSGRGELEAGSRMSGSPRLLDW